MGRRYPYSLILPANPAGACRCSSFNRSCDYRAWPIISAKDPATRAAGTPAPRLTAPPVLVAEGAERVGLEVEVTRGVELAGTVIRLELGVGVAVTEFTLTRVLVMVVVVTEVVSSAATNWAVARQRKEVKRAPNCIFADCCVSCRVEECVCIVR